MEYKHKLVDAEENKSKMTYLLQLETALRNAQADKKILADAVESYIKEIARLKLENDRLRAGTIC